MFLILNLFLHGSFLLLDHILLHFVKCRIFRLQHRIQPGFLSAGPEDTSCCQRPFLNFLAVISFFLFIFGNQIGADLNQSITFDLLSYLESRLLESVLLLLFWWFFLFFGSFLNSIFNFLGLSLNRLCLRLSWFIYDIAYCFGLHLDCYLRLVVLWDLRWWG